MKNIETDNIIAEYDRNEPRCSPKDIKKIKATKFYNRNNRCYWIDNNGFFYKADKTDLPSKESKDEFKMFGGNKEAVYVCWGTEVAFLKRKWFNSIEEFLEFFESEKQKQPRCYGTLYYKVLKRGYTKVAPEERKVIFKFPYINIENTVAELSRWNFNKNYVLYRCAQIWCEKMNGIQFFGNCYEHLDLMLDIIKKYLEWKSEKE